MKVVILFVGYETSVETESPTHLHGLLNMAGSTILGHILLQLDAVLTGEVVLVVNSTQQPLFASWLAENYPDLAVCFIVQKETDSIGQTLQTCADCFDVGELLLVSGHVVVEADFTQLPSIAAHENATAVIITDTNEKSAGIIWLNQGTLLRTMLATQPINQFSDLLATLQACGVIVAKTTASFCLDTRTTPDYFYANRRLLGLGYGTQDVIERSYADDFTVFPPVFLHETAVIENAVIGPFVNIEAGAIVRNSIIKNSFIDADAHVETVILADSMIGTGARVNGRVHTIILQDNKSIDLD